MLLSKITSLSFKGKAVNFFESDITKKKQVVKLKQALDGVLWTVKSKPVTTRRGVP